jgi:hypothetical protein
MYNDSVPSRQIAIKKKDKAMSVTKTLSKPEEEARIALRNLLIERPEFMDTSRNRIQDIVPFLEEEYGFPTWFSHYENNYRGLSSVWSQVIKQMKTEPPVQYAEPEPVVEVQPEPVAPAKTRSAPRKKATSKDEPVVEETTALVVSYEESPVVLEEQLISASRALAEQFAIVKHHEQAMKQALQIIEDANEALVRARQSHANASTAYTNALEDLARLMANSLGNKAGDFSKLVAKAAVAENSKGR